jgi:hypothetical protein
MPPSIWQVLQPRNFREGHDIDVASAVLTWACGLTRCCILARVLCVGFVGELGYDHALRDAANFYGIGYCSWQSARIETFGTKR